MLVAIALVSLLAGAYVAVARTLPALELASQAKSAPTTKIYDDSPTPVLIAELHGLEDREVLSGEEMPQLMRDAVVAAEDPRFYERSEAGFLTILRAAWASFRHEKVDPGGSTITRQIIENASISDQGGLDSNLRLVATTYRLERRWSKEKILNEYLNLVYFGSGAYGVQAAARVYFGVDAADLTVAQAALLAGLPAAPSIYSPHRDPAAALARRDLVLNKMYQQRYISSDQLQEALVTSLQLADPAVEASTYAPYWVELVREQLVARYGSSTVLGGGLRVYISMDLRLQQAAEDAVELVLSGPNDPDAAVAVIDVHSGQMVAMVGGPDFREPRLNLATQARRQPGSAFETFVLVAALKEGVSPEATFGSDPVSGSLPGDSIGVVPGDGGPVTLARATADSCKGAYARLAAQLGAVDVARTAADMGLAESLGAQPDPGIAVGRIPKGVTPLEMAMAYAALAAGGERLEQRLNFDPSKPGFPVTIVSVTDADGHILDENGSVRTRVLDEGLAALATSCLRAVIEVGDGRAADIGRPAAGKTGFTDDNRDEWFIGYTPDLVAAVWVGHSDDHRPMTGRAPATGGAPGTGGTPGTDGAPATGGAAAARIWAAFMETALAGTPVSDFSLAPAGRWVTVDVCAESHLPPTELCPAVVKMLFAVDAVPPDTCGIHVPKAVFMPDVVGMSLTRAKRLLAEGNLTVKTVQSHTSLEPAGTVIRQSFPAGKPILQGSEVVLHVSSGRAAEVPDVVGLPLDQAQALLAAAGFSIEIVQQPAGAPPGTVLSQDPAAGAAVAKDSAIRLVVSSGPDAPPGPV
jgi:penicillin-binding protein 1A